MKEKTKKILKGFGIGALACVGMVGLTGCSLDLSQEQIDKLMYAVDNSQQFMDNTLNLLEKQNAKMTNAEAYKLYDLACAKLFTNADGIRNNLVITSNFESDHNSTVEEVRSFYNNGTDNALIINHAATWENDSEAFISIRFELNETVYRGSKRPTDTTFDPYKDSDHRSLDSYIYAEDEIGILGDDWGLKKLNSFISPEDISSVTILANGNYLLEFAKNTYSFEDDNGGVASLVYSVEITKDAKLLEQKISIQIVETSSFIATSLVKYSYGTVDTQTLLQNLNSAKAELAE